MRTGVSSFLVLLLIFAGFMPAALLKAETLSEFTSAKLSKETKNYDFSSELSWQPIHEGLSLAKIHFYPKGAFLQAELYVLRFSLTSLKIMLAYAPNDTKTQIASVKDLVLSRNCLAGINASFFDAKEAPLGLILPSPSSLNSKLHLGGQLLTGVFQIKENLPSIIHRSKFNLEGVSFAVQAGPRLFANKKQLTFENSSKTSRRSGIAITEDNEVLLFATLLRFPGSSLEDIQETLLKTGLPILDALNFDGGGSSQLFIKKGSPNIPDDIFISGGDDVPTALVVCENK